MAACVASLLDKQIDEVDVDLAGCEKVSELIRRIEAKAGCKIYGFPTEAITDGIIKSALKYCIVEVCTFINCGNQSWHCVVCEIAEDGALSMVHNPDRIDTIRTSLDQFRGTRNLYFVG